MTRPPREAEEPARVTLAPLTPEEALRALLAVKPDDDRNVRDVVADRPSQDDDDSPT